MRVVCSRYHPGLATEKLENLRKLVCRKEDVATDSDLQFVAEEERRFHSNTQ